MLGAGDARQLGVDFGSIPRRGDEWERREAERPGGGCGEEGVEERRGETERGGGGGGGPPNPHHPCPLFAARARRARPGSAAVSAERGPAAPPRDR